MVAKKIRTRLLLFGVFLLFSALFFLSFKNSAAVSLGPPFGEKTIAAFTKIVFFLGLLAFLRSKENFSALGPFSANKPRCLKQKYLAHQSIKQMVRVRNGADDQINAQADYLHKNDHQRKTSGVFPFLA